MSTVTVRCDWDLEFDVADVIRCQAADPALLRARSPRLIALTEEALTAGRILLAPAVLTRRIDVVGSRHNRMLLGDGHTVTGPLIAEHLGGASEVVAMLCTVGDALERAVAAASETNPSYGLALDAVGSAAVQALNAAACNEVERTAHEAGLQTSLPLCPGMEGWSVDPGQREIFALLDGAEIGVTVSPTLQMSPLKSLTTLIGIGEEIAIAGAICDYCGLRNTCRHKIA